MIAVIPDAVSTVRTVKQVQYAKGNVPVYLLVDIKNVCRWILHGLAEGWQRYQIPAEGAVQARTSWFPSRSVFTMPNREVNPAGF